MLGIILKHDAVMLSFEVFIFFILNNKKALMWH